MVAYDGDFSSLRGHPQAFTFSQTERNERSDDEDDDDDERKAKFQNHPMMIQAPIFS